MKHIKTPVRIVDANVIVGDDHRFVTSPFGNYYSNGKEVAKDIELALNSHDELVELVQLLGERLAAHNGVGPVAKRARETLAKLGIKVEW